MINRLLHSKPKASPGFLEECFQEVLKTGNEYFGVEVNKECYTSKDAEFTYDRIGRVECDASWVIQVYRIERGKSVRISARGGALFIFPISLKVETWIYCVLWPPSLSYAYFLKKIPPSSEILYRFCRSGVEKSLYNFGCVIS